MYCWVECRLDDSVRKFVVVFYKFRCLYILRCSQGFYLKEMKTLCFQKDFIRNILNLEIFNDVIEGVVGLGNVWMYFLVVLLSERDQIYEYVL